MLIISIYFMNRMNVASLAQSWPTSFFSFLAHNTIAGKMYYLHSCSLRTGNIPVLGITLYPAHSIIGSEKRHILTYIYEYIISCLSYFRDYALFILSFPIGVT